MLESKQLELSRHLKEISHRNDQAINDIRRKYEVEKQECINLEKEKAEKAVVDMEKKCDQKLLECKEESKQHLLQIEGEHATLKTKSLKTQHEAELRELRSQHEEECRHLEEELNIQKSKEERQRALLQLQWKVMGDEPQEDQEVTSRKNYSTSSKLRNSDGAKRSNHTLVRREDGDLPYMKPTQSPVSTMLKKADKGNTGSVISIPKHSKKEMNPDEEEERKRGCVQPSRLS